MALSLRSLGDRLTGRTDARLRQEVIQTTASYALLQERIAELELAREDQGWNRLSAEGRSEFSREGLAEIIYASRLAYLKNPLIRRAIDVSADYTWSLGVNIVATNPEVNTVVQSFMSDPDNQTELFSPLARIQQEIELRTTGNLFFAFFTSSATGKTKLRTIPVDEIVDVICNPDDAKDPWYYKRVYLQRVVNQQTGTTETQTRTVYHPCYRYRPVGGWPDVFAGQRVMRNAPIYHVKIGGFGWMRFGVPEIYPALDWSKAHKSFLEDCASVARSLSRFAWRLITKGGIQGLSAAKSKFTTMLGLDSPETNPRPSTGSILMSTDAHKIEPIKASGMAISPSDARYYLLQVASAVGLPETFFGDTSSGNLATAESLDRPTELKMHTRQMLWASVLTTILLYVIERFALATGKFGVTEEAEDDQLITVWSNESQREVAVGFPDILERDADAMVRAIVQGATLGGQPMAGTIDRKTTSLLLLQALGVPNPNELIAKYYQGKDEGELLPEPPPIVSPGGPGEPNRSGQAGNQSGAGPAPAASRSQRRPA